MPLPETTKPTINVSLPVPEKARAEKLTMWLNANGAIAMVTVAAQVPVPLVAVMAVAYVPAVVGVPLISGGAQTRPKRSLGRV